MRVVFRCFFILNFLLVNYSYAIPEFLNKPIFYFEPTNKKLINIGIGGIFEETNLNYKNPSILTNTSYNNLKNLGITTYLTLNVTCRAWLKFQTDVSVVTNGNGIIDNMSNGYGDANFKTANGMQYELRFVTGIDLLKIYKLDKVIMEMSLYGGWLYKNFNYKMSKGSAGPVSLSGVSDSSMSDTTDNIILNGGLIGINLAYHHSESVIANFATEIYITKFHSKSYLIASEIMANMSAQKPMLGFGLIGSIDINVANNIWVSPFAKYQQIQGRITQESRDGIISNANIGNFNYSTIMTGIVLSWR